MRKELFNIRLSILSIIRDLDRLEVQQENLESKRILIDDAISNVDSIRLANALKYYKREYEVTYLDEVSPTKLKQLRNIGKKTIDEFKKII